MYDGQGGYILVRAEDIAAANYSAIPDAQNQPDKSKLPICYAIQFALSTAQFGGVLNYADIAAAQPVEVIVHGNLATDFLPRYIQVRIGNLLHTINQTSEPIVLNETLGIRPIQPYSVTIAPSFKTLPV